jgi:hypothetical protein
MNPVRDRPVVPLATIYLGRVNRRLRVEMSCEIFAGFDEMIYSIADHGGKTAAYDGGVYIKEAESSALL